MDALGNHLPSPSHMEKHIQLMHGAGMSGGMHHVPPPHLSAVSALPRLLLKRPYVEPLLLDTSPPPCTHT